ncbi:MAG: HEAT repeat domain-containing protein [Candidatus Lokiarchaeota archaeon]|nr:HEAT repeat domain-containing protein [Candidatus Harpocratesius repetitus]
MSQQVSSLLQQLKSEDNEVKLLAIKRLGMIYDDESIIDPLLRLLLDGNPKVREAAILSLSVQPAADKIVNPIINAINDEDLNVQLAAIKTLSEFRAASAVKPLIKILSDPHEEIRAAAVLALGLIEDKNSLFPLIECLEDENSQVRVNALVALSNLGDPRSVEPIIELIDTETDDAVKQMAILTLGPLGQKDKRIIPPLVKLLQSDNPRFRQYAVLSLGQTKSPEIIEPLLNVLNDEDSYVRRACASALSDIKDPATVRQFIDRLHDPSPEIRETAANALGKLGDPTAVEPLIELLNDESYQVREEACNALGVLQDKVASKPIISLIKKEKNPEILIAATRALGKIEGNNESAVPFHFLNPANRPLTKLLNHRELSVRAAAAESLAKIALSEQRYSKASQYFMKASQESLTWEFRQPFYIASSKGCIILERISKKNYSTSKLEFDEIYEHLDNAARMLGNQSFISKGYWQVLEVYNQVFKSKNKGQFIQHFQDLGLKILLLEKKLPEDLRPLLTEPQNRLNEKFIQINKRGLTLDAALHEIELLKDEIQSIGNIILQIEPLELRMDEDQEFTLHSIEDLIVTPTTTDIEPKFREEDDEIIQRRLKMTQESKRNFILEEVTLDTDLTMFAGKTVNIALIQYLKGSPRQSMIEDNRTIWERHIKRYYNYELFRRNRILQFTKESIQMRSKPKVIGYLDDAIYEGNHLIIFPETSMPESYLTKLQQFADRFNIFIITGSETIASKSEGKFLNRAFVISPLADDMVYQEKNIPTILPPTERHLDEWRENINTTSPPVLRIINSPFGRFLILIGQDIKEHSQFLPFIAEQKHLNFVVFLNNGYWNNVENEFLNSLAEEIKIPILYVNSGQFGGTGVYLPGKKEENPLQKEFTEGMLKWEYKVPETPFGKNNK